jgi:hypothetical protein
MVAGGINGPIQSEADLLEKISELGSARREAGMTRFSATERMEDLFRHLPEHVITDRDRLVAAMWSVLTIGDEDKIERRFTMDVWRDIYGIFAIKRIDALKDSPGIGNISGSTRIY